MLKILHTFLGNIKQMINGGGSVAFNPGLNIGQILKMQTLLIHSNVEIWVVCVVQELQTL